MPFNATCVVVWLAWGFKEISHWIQLGTREILKLNAQLCGQSCVIFGGM